MSDVVSCLLDLEVKKKAGALTQKLKCTTRRLDFSVIDVDCIRLRARHLDTEEEIHQ